MIKLAQLLMVHTAIVAQPTVTISWNPVNDGVLHINYLIYTGPTIKSITNLEASTGQTNYVSPMNIPIKFFHVVAQNELGQVSQ